MPFWAHLDQGRRKGTGWSGKDLPRSQPHQPQTQTKHTHTHLHRLLHFHKQFQGNQHHFWSVTQLFTSLVLGLAEEVLQKKRWTPIKWLCML